MGWRRIVIVFKRPSLKPFFFLTYSEQGVLTLQRRIRSSISISGISPDLVRKVASGILDGRLRMSSWLCHPLPLMIKACGCCIRVSRSEKSYPSFVFVQTGSSASFESKNKRLVRWGAHPTRRLFFESTGVSSNGIIDWGPYGQAFHPVYTFVGLYPNQTPT